MPKSSIDHLLGRVDWRCSKCNIPLREGCHCWDRVTPEERTNAATEVRWYVREHIRTMYPEVWSRMSRSARRSILNCVYNAVHAALGTLNPQPQDWPGDAD